MSGRRKKVHDTKRGMGVIVLVSQALDIATGTYSIGKQNDTAAAIRFTGVPSLLDGDEEETGGPQRLRIIVRHGQTRHAPNPQNHSQMAGTKA